MKKLSMDRGDLQQLLPRDFAEMHGRLTARCRAIADEKRDRQITARLPELGEYYFSALGLVLRPLESAREVIREGNTLHHCVGGYVDRYAEGGTTLLCLREEERLEEPLYTVEYTVDGRRVQCRGDHNHTRPQDEDRLALFWKLYDSFRKEYFRAHPRKTKGRKAA